MTQVRQSPTIEEGVLVGHDGSDGAQEALIWAARLAVRDGLDACVAAAGLDPSVRVHAHVVHGPPAKELIEAAKGADLVVVGARGHGGFTGLLLGSVSDQCVHHAPCPVTVGRRGAGRRLLPAAVAAREAVTPA